MAVGSASSWSPRVLSMDAGTGGRWADVATAGPVEVDGAAGALAHKRS